MTLLQSSSPQLRRTSSIRDDEMKSLQGEFLGLGGNGKNEIPIAELRNLLISMRIKLRLGDDDIDRAIKQIDKDDDGVVDLRELEDVIERYDTQGIIYKALSQRCQIRKEFERYDADKSGYITVDELVRIVNERTGIAVKEKYLNRMLRDVDTNDDGLLDYEEFCTLMTKSFMAKRILTSSPRTPKPESKNSKQKFTYDKL